MPPAAITGSPGEQHLAEEFDVGSRERSVARGARDEQPSDPGRGAILGECRSRRARAPRPTVDRDLAVTDVDRDDELIGEPGGCSAEERGGERGSADHHAVGARRDRVGDRALGAVAASDLERKPSGGGDTLDEPERGRAVECSVEVDEMEASGALVPEPAGKLDRIAALDGHGLPAALMEPDDASFEDVDRGKNVEVLC